MESGHHAKRISTLHEGLRQIQLASCDMLRSHEFMQSAIEHIGLKHDARGKALYGNASRHMLERPSPWSPQLGLWQDPSQLAAALVQLGSSQREVRSYIEIGCATGWTACVLAAYMQRVGHRLSGLAVDLANTSVTIDLVLPLFKHLGLAYMGRTQVTAVGSKSNLRRTLPGHNGTDEGIEQEQAGAPFDLCFIDAQHSYAGVLEDFSEFAPHCRQAVFHDIQDWHTLHLSNYSGGVPLFWSHLSLSSHQQRLSTHTSQLADASAPVFGIGIIGPNAHGTAEPDRSLSRWPEWRYGLGHTLLIQQHCMPSAPAMKNHEGHEVQVEWRRVCAHLMHGGRSP
jgi:hypothetical protein